MATIKPTLTQPGGDGSIVLCVWADITTADDTYPLQLMQWGDRCVQVFGTFGVGGSLRMEGSNDGVTWAVLNSSMGSPLTFTTAGINQVVELPVYIRPSVTAGDGTTLLTASLLLRRNQPLRT